MKGAEATPMETIKIAISIFFPKIAIALKWQFLNVEGTEFIVNIIKQTIEQRRNSSRKDMVVLSLLLMKTMDCTS